MNCSKLPPKASQPFRAFEIVHPSGLGRTSSWPKTDEGTVVKASKRSVFVRWHNSCVEDEMSPKELVHTGRFAKVMPSGTMTVVLRPTRRWLWVRRDRRGVVLASLDETQANQARELIDNLKQMALAGPVERVCVRAAVVGEPLGR